MHYRVCFPVIALSLAAAPAAAQPATPYEVADELFRRGLAAATEHNHRHALTLFQESHAVWPKAAALYNVASCEEELGRLSAALEHFQKVVLDLPPDDDRVPIAKRRAAALDGRVPRVHVDLAPGSPPFTVVLRDGAPVAVAASGVELRVDPGVHTLVVNAPDRAEHKYVIAVAERERHTISVAPGPEITRPRTPDTSPRPPSAATGWIVLGSGLFTAAGGAVALLLSLGGAGAANQPPVHAHLARGRPMEEHKADVQRWIGGCALAAGALAAGAGLYLALRDPKRTALPPVTVSVMPAGAGLRAGVGVQF
jgi:tetratricopeptide (TPR) repeat protein